jgi:hypothetical protein
MTSANTIAALDELIDRASDAIDRDTAHWDALACGQDSEEAEASGMLAGIHARNDRRP